MAEVENPGIQNRKKKLWFVAFIISAASIVAERPAVFLAEIDKSLPSLGGSSRSPLTCIKNEQVPFIGEIPERQRLRLYALSVR